ncbi:MAG: dTMP kinase, partial [Verrucomicrobia bacterium]
STTAYQGAARALSRDHVVLINQIATGGLLPDITILLDQEVSLGRARLNERNKKVITLDRMEKEPEAFYEAVRQEYLNLAAANPDRWIVIDASQTPQQVTEQIVNELQKRCSVNDRLFLN